MSLQRSALYLASGIKMPSTVGLNLMSGYTRYAQMYTSLLLVFWLHPKHLVNQGGYKTKTSPTCSSGQRHHCTSWHQLLYNQMQMLLVLILSPAHALVVKLSCKDALILLQQIILECLILFAFALW